MTLRISVYAATWLFVVMSAGIMAGDVVLSLNDTPVKSVEQLQSLLSKAEKHVALLVQRENTKIFVPVDLG